MDQLLTDISLKVKLTTGPVRTLYTVDGVAVKGLEGLHDQEIYICCAGEKFDKSKVPTKAKSTESGFLSGTKSPARALSPGPGSSSSSNPSPARKSPIQKFGLQVEKARVIMAFKNGDKNHKGVRITIHPTKFKTYDQLRQAITKEVPLPTGPVRNIYDALTHQLVRDLDDFKGGGIYVCCGAEKLNLPDLPVAIEKLIASVTPEESTEGTSDTASADGGGGDGVADEPTDTASF